MKVETRKTWRNHTKNQSIDPLRIYWPESADDLVAVVAEAIAQGVAVRAVGSGHSWSDVALTSGFLVQTSRLPAFVERHSDSWRTDVDETLVRVGAGTPLRDLNAALDEQGLALSNMGGYDAQTMAGVISTSTHGSGIGFGPLSSFARSLDLVGGDAKRYRIERADGPTDPARFSGGMLVQDDRWFRAAVVGMGCMGLIHGVTLEVEPEYALTEVRVASDWSRVKDDLRAGEIDRHRHYEVYVNPHEREGRNLCMITTRELAKEVPESLPSRRRNSLAEFVAMFPLTPHVLNLIIDLFPSRSPALLDWGLGALADKEYTSASYKVLNIGAANLMPAYSAEIAVPVDEQESHIRAVDRIIEIADRHRRIGGVYHTSPISLRFVDASDAYMSMMQGRKTMMIELIQMTRTEGGMELLAAYERELAAMQIGARPHWGQVNDLNGERVQKLYPHFGDWLDVHAELNPVSVLDGPFSSRVGITEPAE